MRPCPVCFPWGGEPGRVPVVLPLSDKDKALPEADRPPAQVIWVPCTNCIGADASCCENAGATW